MCGKAEIIGSALFLLCVVSAGFSSPALAEVAVPLGSFLAGASANPGDPQFIYCAERAEECFLYCPGLGTAECPRPDTMFIFIYANDPIGVTRAHFRLKADYPCCDSIASVIPCPGVTIEDGDLLQGMTISFPLQHSGHFKALALAIWHDGQDPPLPMSDYGFWVRDAWLERANAETISVYSHRTMPFYPDCFWTWTIWYHPDTMDVFIGSRTDVKVQWEVNGAYYFGYYVTIADEQGWVHDFTPNGAWWTGCLTCPWDIETTHIYTELPEEVPAGTLSTLAITGTGTTPETIILRAVPPIATEKQSWGKMKDLFK